MEVQASKSAGLKTLLLLHKALLIGQLIFAAVAFYLIYTDSFPKEWQHLDQVLQVAAIVFSTTGFFAGSMLFKKRLLKARKTETGLADKWALYRTACIIQWAMIEAPCLFAITCFLLTGNYAFFALAAVLILLFTTMGPSSVKIIFQLQVSEAEIAEL